MAQNLRGRIALKRTPAWFLVTMTDDLQPTATAAPWRLSAYVFHKGVHSFANTCMAIPTTIHLLSKIIIINLKEMKIPNTWQ